MYKVGRKLEDGLMVKGTINSGGGFGWKCHVGVWKLGGRKVGFEGFACSRRTLFILRI